MSLCRELVRLIRLPGQIIDSLFGPAVVEGSKYAYVFDFDETDLP